MTPRPIVLVEDNDDVREILERLLVLARHQVAAAADGPGGIELLFQGGPVFGLIDLGLPKMDGFEVAKQVRRKQGTPPPILIALTGHDLQRPEVLEAGFDELPYLHQVLQRFERA